MPRNTSPNGVGGRSVYHGAVFTLRNTARPVAVIWIHGTGVNFYYPTYVKIGRELAARGYATITANTRMHDLGNVAGFRGATRIRGGRHGCSTVPIPPSGRRVVGIALASGRFRPVATPTDSARLREAMRLIAEGRGEDAVQDPARSTLSSISAATFVDLESMRRELNDDHDSERRSHV